MKQSVVRPMKRQVATEQEARGVAALRAELARKIAAHARTAGEHATSIPGLTLYRRTDTTPCYPATYEPSLNVFVQGQKRITLGGTTYLCDGSTFLLSSLDLPVVSQIVQASEAVPLLSMLLKLDMAAGQRDSESRGVSIAQWFIRGSRHRNRENDRRSAEAVFSPPGSAGCSRRHSVPQQTHST